MKRLMSVTLVAITLLTGCSISNESDPSPSDLTTTNSTEEPHREDLEAEPAEDQNLRHTFQEAIDELDNPLSKEERLDIGYKGCQHILTDAMGEGTDTFLDEITRDNIDLGTNIITVDLIRADVDAPKSHEFTRAAVEYLCPQVKTKMTDDAWKHGIFRDDYIDGITEADEHFVFDLLDQVHGEAKDEDIDISTETIRQYGREICAEVSDSPDEPELRPHYWQIQDEINSSGEFAFGVAVSGLKLECPDKYDAWERK